MNGIPTPCLVCHHPVGRVLVGSNTYPKDLNMNTQNKSVHSAPVRLDTLCLQRLQASNFAQPQIHKQILNFIRLRFTR